MAASKIHNSHATTELSIPSILRGNSHAVDAAGLNIISVPGVKYSVHMNSKHLVLGIAFKSQVDSQLMVCGAIYKPFFLFFFIIPSFTTSSPRISLSTGTSLLICTQKYPKAIH